MRKVPELRFDGFDGEWEEYRFNDITKLSQGLQIPIDERYLLPSDDTYFYITNEFLKPGSKKHYYIKNPNKSVIANKDDILMTRTGNTGKVLTDVEGAFHNNFFKIAYDNSSISKYYLFYLLNSEVVQNKILRLAGSSTILDLNHKDFYSIASSFPSLKEQRKIGKIFKNLDFLIEIQEGKVSKMEDYKKSMLQKMFPKKDELVPEFRFDGFGGKWKNVYVKDVGSFLGGTSIESHFNKKGAYKVISIGSYSNNSKYIDQGLRVDLNDKTKSKLLSRNDLAMVLNDKTTQGNIIGRALLIDEDNKYIFNQRTQRITPNFDKYNSLFLYYLFNSDIFRNKIKKISQGNTQIYVNWPNVESILLKVPTKKEQEKIGQFFKNLDTQIETEEKLLESYKMIKKSLLQKMFV